MKKIITLTQNAYVCSGEYRFTIEEGKCSAMIMHDWYEARGVDTKGNSCVVAWKVKDGYDSEIMGEDMACDWSEPDEIIIEADDKDIVIHNMSNVEVVNYE